MESTRIILVEDDAVIAELLEYNLRGNGYQVDGFRDGQQMFARLAGLEKPSLFILDLMLPGMDGFAICSRLRQDPRLRGVPIMMLTARGSENDKVRGLETGADDYLTKPFSMRELLARVQALIRRYGRLDLESAPAQTQSATGGPVGISVSQATAPWAAAGTTPAAPPAAVDRPADPASGPLSCRGIVLDDIRHRVYREGDEIEMTHREYELLKYLMTHRGVAFSRDELLDAVWGYEYGGETRTVDVHIRQLRRKLETDDANPVLIETVRGRGYRFTDQD
jgi:two-component system alkaline phosphatase synthesis response regulator PhoP